MAAADPDVLEVQRDRVRQKIRELLGDLLSLGATPWDLRKLFDERGWTGLADLREELRDLDGEYLELEERKNRALGRLMAAPGEGW